MARLILIRHGECEGQGAYIGRRSDPPLTSKGRGDVSELRSRLEAWELLFEDVPVSVYVSPLLRAAETAGILLDGRRCGDSVKTANDLAEIDFGLWDGMSWNDISARYPEAYRRWTSDPFAFSPPEGEVFNDFNRRVMNAASDIFRRQKDGDTFIVSHGGVIRSIICSLLKLPEQSHWSFNVSCASFSIVRHLHAEASFDGAVLECLNCR